METLLFIMIWLFAAVVLVALVLRWNAPSDHWSGRMPPYWIWGDSWWRGLRRARLPITIGILALATGGIFPILMPLLGLAAFAVALPLAITTFLFNWPKAIVPPALRDEEGVLSIGRLTRSRS